MASTLAEMHLQMAALPPSWTPAVSYTGRMDMVLLWPLLRLFKLLGVVAYAAGVGIALSPVEPKVRRRAVHFLASPALLYTWTLGYFLTWARGTSLSEAWILGAFGSSLLCHLFLVPTTRAGVVSRGQKLAVIFMFALTLMLMVFRPTLGRM
jgi:hypothetical protein